MNIGKISSTTANKPLITRIVSSKAVRNTVTTLSKNAPMLTVVSVVSKDLVGALVLFFQTKNNERIPEKKRGYLAAYELTSGSYNVLFPLTAGAILTAASFKHKTAKMAFKRYYVDPKTLEQATGAAKEALLKKMAFFEKCNKGLAQFIAIIFTAIISKRIICPFVGGPMATAFNKRFLQKGNEPEQEKGKEQK